MLTWNKTHLFTLILALLLFLSTFLLFSSGFPFLTLFLLSAIFRWVVLVLLIISFIAVNNLQWHNHNTISSSQMFTNTSIHYWIILKTWMNNIFNNYLWWCFITLSRILILTLTFLHVLVACKFTINWSNQSTTPRTYQRSSKRFTTVHFATRPHSSR